MRSIKTWAYWTLEYSGDVLAQELKTEIDLLCGRSAYESIAIDGIIKTYAFIVALIIIAGLCHYFIRKMTNIQGSYGKSNE
jgi:hypothetical protein